MTYESINKIKKLKLYCSQKNCNKIFASCKLLKAHIRKVHCSEKDYVCEKCGVSFTAQYLLNRHYAVHSADRVQCPVCRKMLSKRTKWVQASIFWLNTYLLEKLRISKCSRPTAFRAFQSLEELEMINFWSTIRWLTFLNIKLLVPAVLAVVNTHSSFKEGDVREAASRKNSFQIFITTWWKTCCTDPT
jgi:hypothetical protein